MNISGQIELDAFFNFLLRLTLLLHNKFDKEKPWTVTIGSVYISQYWITERDRYFWRPGGYPPFENWSVFLWSKVLFTTDTFLCQIESCIELHRYRVKIKSKSFWSFWIRTQFESKGIWYYCTVLSFHLREVSLQRFRFDRTIWTWRPKTARWRTWRISAISRWTPRSSAIPLTYTSSAARSTSVCSTSLAPARPAGAWVPFPIDRW
jgi:hypothetical protein